MPPYIYTLWVLRLKKMSGYYFYVEIDASSMVNGDKSCNHNNGTVITYLHTPCFALFFFHVAESLSSG